MRRAEALRPALLPYLALALFGGVRPGELARLDPARIGPAWIVIDGAVAKTSDHRTVPVRPNLRAWLDAHPPRRPIPPLSEKHLYAAIRLLCAATRADPDPASRIVSWPSDCMRHSYASYAYDLTRDAALVASEMGHRGTDIFFRHYRGLVPPGSGAEFFSIFPLAIPARFTND
jgi:integrase